MGKSIPGYNVYVGDRFYHNNYGVQQGHTLPDYLKVLEVNRDFIKVKYEARSIGTKERLMSLENVWFASNRNPKCTRPTWIFVD